MKISRFIIALFIGLSSWYSMHGLHAKAQLIENGEWKYEIVGDHVELAHYLGKSKEVVIPQKIEGMPVTIIRSDAFLYLDVRLTRVVIPDGIEKIGAWAFANNLLTSITLPDSVTVIGDAAFSRNKLTSVEIPKKVTSIGKSAFMLNQLTSVTLPEGLEEIGASSFTGNRLTSIDLPSHLQIINSRAFEDNELKTLTLPPNVKSIGNRAFGTNKLTSLTITHAVEMNDYVFEGNQLAEVNLPDEQMSISDGAFSRNNLSHITLPKSLQSIGDSAFDNNHLTSIDIPAGVKKISDFAFNNNELEHVNLNQVESTGYSSFSQNQLKEIELPKTLTTIGRSSFESNKLTTVVISDNVIEMENNAFQWNPLKRVSISKNIAVMPEIPFGTKSQTLVDEKGKNIYLMGWFTDASYTTQWKPQAGQTVYVKWNHQPTLTGVTNTSVRQSTLFDPMEGISAVDEEDGDISKKVKIKGNLDTEVPGTYTLDYSVTDADGYYTSSSRTIRVISYAKPIFHFNEPDSMPVGVSTNLYDVTVTDNEDGAINNFEVIGSVNRNVIGRYLVIYIAKDSDGNERRVERTITVLPGIVENVKVTKRTTSSLAYQWTTQNGATGYKIYVYDKNGKLLQTKKTSKSSIVLSSLPSGASINVKVRSYKTFVEKTMYGPMSTVSKTATLPAKPKLKSVKKNSATSLTANWGAINATGYELQYSYSKSFTKATTKTVNVTKSSVVSKKVTGLIKGKKYYVRVRGYVTSNKVKYYGAWSNIK